MQEHDSNIIAPTPFDALITLWQNYRTFVPATITEYWGELL